MYPNGHHSTVYNSQDMETTWMSISRGMDKKDMVHYIMEYYAVIKKEQNSAIHSDIDDSRDCHTE